MHRGTPIDEARLAQRTALALVPFCTGCMDDTRLRVL